MPISQNLRFLVDGHERLVTSVGRQQGSRPVFELLWSELLPWLSGGTVLDVGCGDHEWSTTDYSVARCDVAPTGPKGYTRIRPEEPLPYSDGKFDVAIAAEVIEHTENPWAFVRELCRVARSRVVISTPNPQCALSKRLFDQYGFFADFTTRHNQEIGHWTPVFGWQMDEMARRAGWVVARTDLIGGHFGDLRVPVGTLDPKLMPLVTSNNTERCRVVVLVPA